MTWAPHVHLTAGGGQSCGAEPQTAEPVLTWAYLPLSRALGSLAEGSDPAPPRHRSKLMSRGRKGSQEKAVCRGACAVKSRRLQNRLGNRESVGPVPPPPRDPNLCQLRKEEESRRLSPQRPRFMARGGGCSSFWRELLVAECRQADAPGARNAHLGTPRGSAGWAVGLRKAGHPGRAGGRPPGQDGAVQ